jgi:hypothetical protein
MKNSCEQRIKYKKKSTAKDINVKIKNENDKIRTRYKKIECSICLSEIKE